jgi:hypothetical protein
MIISRVKETIENQKKRILGHETHLEPLIVVVARRCRVGVVMFLWWLDESWMLVVVTRGVVVMADVDLVVWSSSSCRY